MTLPVILDAGPILTFFVANQERLLIGVVGPLTMPRTVHDEVEGKAARDSRFSAAAGVLRKRSDWNVFGNGTPWSVRCRWSVP